MKKLFIIFLFIGIILSLAGCNNQINNLKLISADKQVEESDMIRNPAVAGSFYPNDKTALIDQVNGFLTKAKKIDQVQPLRILLVPHAGWDYSGQVAGWGFKQLSGSKYSKVILLGSSHQAYFANGAVYSQGAWQTPIGKVAIDQSLASSLISQVAGLEANESAHKSEHSLEVELPFLQQTLTDFKIVPILLGQTDDDFLASLAQAIAANFDDQTLLVISSDLSHYPDYQTANRVDNQTIEAIISGDLAKFAQIVSVNLDQPGVETCACGQQAIKVGLIMANQLKLKQIKLLNYANSGDVTNDKTRVVGYASIGFFGQIPKIKTKGLLNSQQQQQLLAIARQTLEAYFQNGKIPDIKVDDPGLSQALGAFVTLKKDDQLRGCIGEFEPKQPLYQVVWQKAIDAAIHDSRFMPVTKSELKDIMIEISVLSPRQKINDWQQIKLGQHGVVVKKGLRGGTFLPQVATETGWDLKTFLSNLCSQKAGLASDCYQDPDTEIFVFTAQVFSEAEGL